MTGRAYMGLSTNKIPNFRMSKGQFTLPPYEHIVRWATPEIRRYCNNRAAMLCYFIHLCCSVLLACITHLIETL